MLTPADANLVPGLIPRRWAGAPAPYRGSTLVRAGFTPTRRALTVGTGSAGRGAVPGRIGARRCGSRPDGSPARLRGLAEAGRCDASACSRDGFRGAASGPPLGPHRTREQPGIFPPAADFGFIPLPCSLRPSPMPRSSRAAERRRGCLARARLAVLALRLRHLLPGVPAAPGGRRGGLPGGLLPGVPAPGQAPRRRGHPSLDRAADAPALHRQAARRLPRGNRRPGVDAGRRRRQDGDARRGLRRPRGDGRALRELPRDPRPLLRPRRELPDDRLRARHPVGHDRQQNLRCLSRLREHFAGRNPEARPSS